MNYREVSEFINSNTGGSDQMMIIAVMTIILFCIVSLVGGYFSLLRIEGDTCEIKFDKNAEGIVDEEGKCKFARCKDTYDADATGKCVLNQSGGDCTPEETPDVNGIYNTNVSNVCEFVGCTIGYQLDEDGICAEIEDELPGVILFEPSVSGVVNCEATLSDWSDCSQPCDKGGTQTRQISYTRNESGGGTCPEKLEPREQSCNTNIPCYEIADHHVTPIPGVDLDNNSNTQKLQEIGWIDCNGNVDAAYFRQGGLNRFQLLNESRYSHSQGKYEFSCLNGINKGNPVDEYFPEQKSAVAAFPDHRAYDLDYFPVDCGEYPISAFKLGGDVSSAWYDFKCATAAPHTGVCRELNTEWDDASDKVVYLDRHDVTCGEDEVITKFALKNNTDRDKFRYDYTCCKMPYPGE